MRNHFLFAGALLVLDAFVLNQGAIAAVMLLLVLVVVLPVAVYRLLRHADRRLLATCAIYAVAAVLVFAANHVNNRIAAARATELIAAIARYKSETGDYPVSLEALVPAYVDRVPRAKYAVLSADFSYQSRPGLTTLSYMELPPFGRPTYDFEKGIWFYLD